MYVMFDMRICAQARWCVLIYEGNYSVYTSKEWERERECARVCVCGGGGVNMNALCVLSNGWKLFKLMSNIGCPDNSLEPNDWNSWNKYRSCLTSKPYVETNIEPLVEEKD
jgi:hypothetical protein